ncbi:hypothetical protein [Amycolatopsis sp. MtRt-6]|uniref:hypothetical protein n=1 Tax=Amycolatopsis sp. MtRt-6 TaxID=2792782 RepID=UPI001A8D2293|nr:hypothetical protein [Amycolatopsis sp. MtRt-6]
MSTAPTGSAPRLGSAGWEALAETSVNAPQPELKDPASAASRNLDQKPLEEADGFEPVAEPARQRRGGSEHRRDMFLPTGMDTAQVRAAAVTQSQGHLGAAVLAGGAFEEADGL